MYLSESRNNRVKHVRDRDKKMKWEKPTLLAILLLFLVCRGLDFVTATKISGTTLSERVKLGICSFKRPDVTELGQCIENSWNYSQCTCAKRGVYTFCSSKGLTNVPGDLGVIRVLLLDHNSISEINEATFENGTNLLYLDLSNNGISAISKRAFIRLHKLETLLLQNNHLRYQYLEGHLLSIDFRPLNNLKCLRIEQKTENDTDLYPIDSIQSLQKLHTLYLNGIPGRTFNAGFLNLTNLRDLVLNGVEGVCNLSLIEKDEFKNLTQITGLSLIKCNLRHVEDGSFSELTHLKSLNLSYNEGLEFKSMRNITHGLANLTDFEWLNLTKIHSTFGRCTYLDEGMIEYLNQTSISKLILDLNRLSDVTLDAVDYFPQNLTYLSINKNKMDIDFYLIKIVCNFKNLFGRLNTFEMSNQNYRRHISEMFPSFQEQTMWSYENNEQTMWSHVNDEQTQSSLAGKYSYKNSDFINFAKCWKHIQQTCSGCPMIFAQSPFSKVAKDGHLLFPFPFTQKLETLDFSGSLYKLSMDNICLCKPNNLLNLKLNRNLIYSFPGPFFGFEELQTLDLAENYCHNITEASFSNMTNLKQLNLSSNYLGSIINNVTALLPFENLVNLKQLDLSNNKLRTLPFQVFANLLSLKYLSLSENRLSRIDVNISSLVHLRYINLSGNLIETFSGDVREALTKVSSKNKLRINLFDNKFICNCKHQEYIKWIVLNQKMFVKFEKYYCYFDKGDTVYLRYEEILNRLRKECTDYSTVVIVTSLCVGVTLIGIISAVLYRYRWRIRYMYYSAKLRYKGYSRVDEDDHFQFDFFISYADTDKKFVRESMIPELEEKRGLRLLIHERDFPFGQQVIENIHNAISSSRKTLLLISHGFLQSKWCKYEMNIAKIEEIKRDREVLCVVLKEHAGSYKITKNTYLTVPRNQEDLGRFWDMIQ